MNKDQHLEQEQMIYEEDKEKLISSWVKNGATQVDAEQLFDDMVNDQFHSATDMTAHYDTTIDDRIKRYSKPNS